MELCHQHNKRGLGGCFVFNIERGLELMNLFDGLWNIYFFYFGGSWKKDGWVVFDCIEHRDLR